jgi:hypothetical protein
LRIEHRSSLATDAAGASAGCNQPEETDGTVEPFAKGLAAVCGRSWSVSYSRVDAVLRLAPRSRRYGDALAAGTNPKAIAMASKQPLFRPEMLPIGTASNQLIDGLHK